MLTQGSPTPSRPESLNATFLPVKRGLQTELNQFSTARSGKLSDEQLDHVIRDLYDYDRAGELLEKLQHSHTGGPYIVSNRTALSLANGVQEPYLDQDITACGASPEFAGPWVRIFERISAEQNWASQKLNVFAIDLIAALSTAGEQVGIAAPAIQQAIKLISGKKTESK
jgi:hypothetical protein